MGPPRREGVLAVAEGGGFAEVEEFAPGEVAEEGFGRGLVVGLAGDAVPGDSRAAGLAPSFRVG
jgi:hypothetical protein